MDQWHTQYSEHQQNKCFSHENEAKESIPYLCLSGYIIKISEYCFFRGSGAKWSLLERRAVRKVSIYQNHMKTTLKHFSISLPLSGKKFKLRIQHIRSNLSLSLNLISGSALISNLCCYIRLFVLLPNNS